MVFGMPTTGAPFFASLRGDPERVLAADGNERVEPEPLDVAQHLIASVDALPVDLVVERVGARGAEVRAAVEIPVADLLDVERAGLVGGRPSCRCQPS